MSTQCPGCGGVTNNGHDHCDPPTPYLCTKCAELPVLDLRTMGRAGASVLWDENLKLSDEIERLHKEIRWLKDDLSHALDCLEMYAPKSMGFDTTIPGTRRRYGLSEGSD